ncbi:hypothetical protein [Hydrocoleum sp. CS-953]|nr:hypothetical protein [Hydrocoleum sp. CS-953]
MIEQKVKLFLAELTNSEKSYEQVISTLISAADKQPRVGCQMPDFLEKN